MAVRPGMTCACCLTENKTQKSRKNWLTFWRENAIVSVIVYQENAVTGSSTFVLEFRKLSGDARQQKREWELTSERLPEIERRVGADGIPAVIRAEYKISGSVFVECVIFTNRSGTA